MFRGGSTEREKGCLWPGGGGKGGADGLGDQKDAGEVVERCSTEGFSKGGLVNGLPNDRDVNFGTKGGGGDR